MSLENGLNSLEHPAALSNGWKIAVNHWVPFFRVSNK